MNHLDKFQKKFINQKIETRKTLNKSKTKVSFDFVKNIDNGIKSEQLDIFIKNKEYQILKYKTQITLHGVFDILEKDLYYFNNIIVNKNKTLGIKYNAIDKEKKQYIYKILRLFENFEITENSTKYEAVQFISFRNRDKANLELKKMEKRINNIPSDLFLGNFTCILCSDVYGCFHLKTTLDIKFIYQEKMNILISALGYDAKKIDSQIIDFIKHTKEKKLWKFSNLWD